MRRFPTGLTKHLRLNLGQKGETKKSKGSRVKRLLKYRFVGLAMIALLAFAFLPIFTSTKSSTSSITYVKQNIQDPALELHQSNLKQLGANGETSTSFRVHKSLYNIIFGGVASKKEISSKVLKTPVPQITDSGTKRYQYMYCSNGSYRFYTDDQFKNPNIGFTHASADNCAANNQGTETQLADTAPHGNLQAPLNFASSNFFIPSCTTTSVPYSIEYQSVSWLPAGQTQTDPGLNGTYFSCLGTTVQPINEVIYTGTGPDYNAVADQEAQTQARQKCTNQYNSARAQIEAAGAGDSSAMDELQALYNQCLTSAG